MLGSNANVLDFTQSSKLDIKIDAGTTWRIKMNLFNDTLPADLTDYQIFFSVFVGQELITKFDWFIEENQVVFNKEFGETKSVPFGKYKYEVKVLDTANDVVKIVSGKFIVQESFLPVISFYTALSKAQLTISSAISFIGKTIQKLTPKLFMNSSISFVEKTQSVLTSKLTFFSAQSLVVKKISTTTSTIIIKSVIDIVEKIKSTITSKLSIITSGITFIEKKKSTSTQKMQLTSYLIFE